MTRERLPLTGPAVETDDNQWNGYTDPARFGQYLVGIHKRGTVAASIAGSVMATGLATGGIDLPAIATVDLLSDTTNTRVIDKTTTVDPLLEPIRIESRTVGARAVPVTEQRQLSIRVTMPDVPNFNLDQTPTAQRITNPGDVRSFTKNIQDLKEEGYQIVGVGSVNLTSDETDTTDGNIGKPSNANVRLAGQYGEFTSKEFGQALKKQGVNLDDVPRTVVNTEVILDAGKQAELIRQAQEAGYDTPVQLIRAYKTDPEGVNTEGHRIMDEFFNKNRGTDFTVFMTRTTVEQQPIRAVTTIERCVTETRINYTTKEEPVKRGGEVPLVLFPFPIGRVRREKDFIEGDTSQNKDTPDDNSPAPHDEHAPLSPQLTETELVATRPPHQLDVQEEAVTSVEAVLPDWAYIAVPAEHRTSSPEVKQQPEEAKPAIANQIPVRPLREAYPTALGPIFRAGSTHSGLPYRDFDRSPKPDRTIAKRTIGGALALAALFSIKLDAGYCPDPANYERQDWSWGNGRLAPLPESLYIGVGIPFTNINTNKVPLWNIGCEERKETTPTAPTCDTRQLVYENDKLVKKTETHHQGATKTTVTIEP